MRSAVIMPDKKIINIRELIQIILVTIKNTWSIPAKLKKIYEYGTDDKDIVKVSYYGISITVKTLVPVDTTTFIVKVS